jgi:hypothetical protein
VGLRGKQLAFPKVQNLPLQILPLKALGTMWFLDYIYGLEILKEFVCNSGWKGNAQGYQFLEACITSLLEATILFCCRCTNL